MANKNPFAPIESTLDRWCVDHDLRPFATTEYTIVYVSGKNDSSFQIAIYPIENEEFRVCAYDVETINGEEFESEWIVRKDDITEALNAAIDKIMEWDRMLRLH